MDIYYGNVTGVILKLNKKQNYNEYLHIIQCWFFIMKI